MSVLKVKDNGEWKAIPSIKGETGDAAGFGTATASVDTGTGTPSCVVTLTGEDTAKNFDFAFHNLMYDDSDLQSDFADLSDDFDVLQGQFDTAVAALTVDSEVADIRVGDDGVTYASAGAAVRGQFHDVKSALTNFMTDNVTLNLRHSDYSIDGYARAANGTFDTYSSFGRTDYIDLKEYKATSIKGIGLNVNNTVALVAFYDSSKAFITAFVGTRDDFTNENPFEIAIPNGARYAVFSRKKAAVTDFAEIHTATKNAPMDYFKYIGADGTEVTTTAESMWTASDYLPIPRNGKCLQAKITATGTNATRAIYYYDKNHTPIKGVVVNSSTLTTVTDIVPMNAVYYRLSGRMVYSGGITASFEETELTIGSSYYTIQGFVNRLGSVDTSSGFHRTDYISVDSTSKNIIAIGNGVSVNNVLAMMAFYDEDKTFIGSYCGNWLTGTHDETYKLRMPDGTKYVILSVKDSGLASVSASIHFVDDEIRTFHVGYGIDGDDFYDSVIDAFMATMTEPKYCVINIKNGEYDIFDELGGEDFLSTITDDDTAYTIEQPWLFRVSVIGYGKVKFVYKPDDAVAELHHHANGLIAPLNVRGDVLVRNIEIDAKNCRYAIHDEVSGKIIYDNTFHYYENMVVKMGIRNSDYGNTFGGGLCTGQDIKVKNCRFINTGSGAAFAYHSHPDGKGCNMEFEGCYFETLTPSYTINFGNWGSPDETEVFINNCYFNQVNGENVIRLGKETSTASTNSFQLYVMNTNPVSVIQVDTLPENPYPPVINQFN